jgi:DNA-binding LytR/AlgR family response regulator
MLHPKKILVIDDDPVWGLFTESIIVESNYNFVGLASTIDEAQKLISKLKPDVVVADVMVDSVSIIPILNQPQYNNLYVVFMTSFTDSKLFEDSKLHPKSTYIIKPFHKLSLVAAIDLLLSKVIQQERANDKYITLQEAQIKRLNIEKIAIIKAEGNYCMITTTENKKFVRKISLKKMMELLDSRFMVVYRGFAVNTNHISKIDFSSQKILIGNQEVPIGREYKDEVAKLSGLIQI